ncbi:MAG TPA: tetratricopeptide repeat protein [Spirochaetota bacterium]|nr:tetratricopeptide repeat protein [Spirochaetota bacterium]
MVKRALFNCVVLLGALLAVAWLDPYRDRVDDGNSRFHQKKYDGALNSYRDAEGYAPNLSERNKLKFNHGDVEYMRGDYDGALHNFRESLKSGDRDVQKKALFNMGNSLLKKGDTEGALNAYINALKIDPAYMPAKKNIEYILKKKDDPKDKKNRKNDKNGNRDKQGNPDRQQGKGDKDRNKGDKDRNKNRGEQENTMQNKSPRGTISREQLKNILESMKNKPVRRLRGKADGRSVPEKNW